MGSFNCTWRVFPIGLSGVDRGQVDGRPFYQAGLVGLGGNQSDQVDRRRRGRGRCDKMEIQFHEPIHHLRSAPTHQTLSIRRAGSFVSDP